MEWYKSLSLLNALGNAFVFMYKHDVGSAWPGRNARQQAFNARDIHEEYTATRS
jgi:hypothetical protein